MTDHRLRDAKAQGELARQLANEVDVILEKYPMLQNAMLVLEWEDDEDVVLPIGLWRVKAPGLSAFQEIAGGDIALAERMEDRLGSILESIGNIKQSAIDIGTTDNGLQDVTESKEETTQVAPELKARAQEFWQGLTGKDKAREFHQLRAAAVTASQKEAEKDDGRSGDNPERSFTLSDYSFD